MKSRGQVDTGDTGDTVQGRKGPDTEDGGAGSRSLGIFFIVFLRDEFPTFLVTTSVRTYRPYFVLGWMGVPYWALINLRMGLCCE